MTTIYNSIFIYIHFIYLGIHIIVHLSSVYFIIFLQFCHILLQQIKWNGIKDKINENSIEITCEISLEYQPFTFIGKNEKNLNFNTYFSKSQSKCFPIYRRCKYGNLAINKHVNPINRFRSNFYTFRISLCNMYVSRYVHPCSFWRISAELDIGRSLIWRQRSVPLSCHLEPSVVVSIATFSFKLFDDIVHIQLKRAALVSSAKRYTYRDWTEYVCN